MLPETRLLSVEMRQQSSLNDDELEFYIDMAINETQRWLEASTRERFLDDDDFIFSLRNGFQLRKIVNKLIPGSFHIEDDVERLDKTKKQNLPDGFSKICEPWIETFVCLCVSKLGIPEKNLFHISDFEEHFYNSIRCSDGTCQENQSRICRVVVTVYELALLCEASRCYTGPRIDRTAVEPLVAYYIADHYMNTMDSKKNKKLEQDNDSVANNPATNEITESEESGYDSSVKGLMNHNKIPLAPKSLPTTVNQLVHEKVTKYLTEQVVIAEGNEDQMSECQFSDTLRSLSPDDFSPPPSSAGTSYCTSREHGYHGIVRKNPYQFLSSSPPYCSLKEERELWKMNQMKLEKYNEQKSKRTKIDLKWVDQFNIWKEKRRAKFESSHSAENATNSTTVAEIEREKLQPSGILARHSEVSPLKRSGRVCGEWTTTMPTESTKKEFTMIMQNKTLDIGQATPPPPPITTTTLQENKQELANNFDRKLSLEDSGHFGGESDDTDERLSASPGTLDSPSSNVARLNISINGKHDMRSLTMGNCYGKLASTAANNGIEVNSKQSPVNVTKLAFALNDGLQKPENGIRRDNVDGSELTYACNLVRFQKERNFGFTLKGGLNSGEPLRIDQVTPGLSADRAGVKAGDILVSVNGALVRDDLIGKANMMIKEAVFVSHVELVLEKSENEQNETNSGISTPRKLSSTSKDFTATGQSNSTNWFLQRRAMFEKLSVAESDVHPAKADFRIEPKTEIIEDMKETSAPKVPYVNTNFGNSVTSRPNVGYRVVSMYEPRQPGRISDFIPEYERKEETSNNYASTYNTMNECVTGSYRRTPSDCCPTLIRNYDLGNCNTNLAVGMALPSYRGEISSVDFEAEPDDASLSKPKHNYTTLKTSINKIGNSNSNNRNVTNSWRAVDNSTNMEFKYWNMAANAVEPDATVLACNNNNSAIMNGNFCSNTENAASSMRRQAYNHWLVQEAEHQRLSDQLISERTTKNHPDEGKKKMPTPQAVSASHLCSHCNMELGHGAAMSIESLKLFYHLSCFKCYVCGVKLGDGAVGADVRVRCGKLHCQSCYSNDEAGYRLSEV
ncbi:LIM and calponin homology domains-containing protein 1 [Trichinella papuae]|uniref:LIM and calponin homology domains-containing protein 1 n=1 Tax=Trichinella papuae TaxID=268474 RepID=A0A0V1MYT3_9BILA|nr:LIM and calponin homology domains-containing protein 1 [Trichinella papuae]